MDLSRTWISADHHFGHENIIKYCARPFGDVSEMDQELVSRHNEVVGQDDLVYFLGDLTLGGAESARAYLGSLYGDIRVVPGSHDYRWLPHASDLVSASEHRVKVLPPLCSLEIRRDPIGNEYVRPLVIVLCHYGMRVWDRSHYGSLHLYGHSHGKLPGKGRSMDVGVDTNDFRPYLLRDVVDLLCQIPVAV